MSGEFQVRVCPGCGGDLWSDQTECDGCAEIEDAARFRREWIAGWEKYVGTAWEAITTAAGAVCSPRELEVINALLIEEMHAGRAAKRLGCSTTTLTKCRDAAFEKIREHEAVANTTLPSRRETAPRPPLRY